jgi:hypothetical protein
MGEGNAAVGGAGWGKVHSCRLFLSVAIIGALLWSCLGVWNAEAAPKKVRAPHDEIPSVDPFAFSIVSQWDHVHLTYAFENGTTDIAGDGEQRAVREGMALWSAASPFTFNEVPVADAEIKIKWATGNHGDGVNFDGLNGVVAHAEFPSNGDVHFDDAENWTLSTRPDDSQPLDLVTIAAHEIGHSLGLGHSTSTTLMYQFPLDTGSRRYLTADDEQGVQSMYGGYPGPRFFLGASHAHGIPGTIFNYGVSGDDPVAGDWDGDGDDTIGVYRPSALNFYLRNSNTTGSADVILGYGATGDIPVVGDWDGDGDDTIGVYRPSALNFYLRNSNTTGSADVILGYGATGDIPVVGDWDGDGDDTIGVYRPSEAKFYLRNTNTTGSADVIFAYGHPDDVPLAGDWNDDGVDSIGVYRPSEGTWYLRNSNSAGGSADLIYDFGNVGLLSPVVGDWDGNGSSTAGVYQ